MFAPSVVAECSSVTSLPSYGMSSERPEVAATYSPAFAYSARPHAENRDTRNPSSRRADTRPRNPVKCVKRLRGLANATQPNELVQGSVTAGQVSTSLLLIFFPTKEGRGAGGMDGLPFPDLPPEPITTLLVNL